MIFNAYHRREFAQSAGAAFTTLLTIVVTTVLVRTLGLAAQGKVDNAEVFMLILLGCMQYVAPALVIAGFIAVMAVVSRAYQDQEMTAWFAAGVSLWRMVRPVLWFVLPILVLAMLCSAIMTPWAKFELQAARERFAERSDVAKVSVGQFRETQNGERIVFIERQSELDRSVENVFVVDLQGAMRTLVAAAKGMVDVDETGQSYLVLVDGRRAQLDASGERFSMVEFDAFGMAIDGFLGMSAPKSLQHKPIVDLWHEDSPQAKGELLSRLSLPISCITLALLAIPLAFVNPRGGQSLNKLLALFIYLTYSNGVSVTQSMVSQERLPFFVAFVLPHVLVLGLFVLLMLYRNRPAGGSLLKMLRFSRS